MVVSRRCFQYKVRRHWLDDVTTGVKVKWVYPQIDESLAIVDIDASEGFVDMWVHFFVAIEDIHRNGY